MSSKNKDIQISGIKMIGIVQETTTTTPITTTTTTAKVHGIRVQKAKEIKVKEQGSEAKEKASIQ